MGAHIPEACTHQTSTHTHTKIQKTHPQSLDTHPCTHELVNDDVGEVKVRFGSSENESH